MDYPVSDPTVGLVGGKFSDGDAVGGVAASRDPAAWANAVTDELLAIITAAGLTPSEADLNQVLDALVLLGLRAATSTLPGVVELATNAEVQSGTDTARVVTPAGLTSFLPKRVFGDNDYLRIPDVAGGLILQFGKIITDSNGDATWTYPIAFPTGCMWPMSTEYSQSGTAHAISSHTKSNSSVGIRSNALTGCSLFTIGW